MSFAVEQNSTSYLKHQAVQIIANLTAKYTPGINEWQKEATRDKTRRFFYPHIDCSKYFNCTRSGKEAQTDFEKVFIEEAVKFFNALKEVFIPEKKSNRLRTRPDDKEAKRIILRTEIALFSLQNEGEIEKFQNCSLEKVPDGITKDLAFYKVQKKNGQELILAQTLKASNEHALSTSLWLENNPQIQVFTAPDSLTKLREKLSKLIQKAHRQLHIKYGEEQKTKITEFLFRLAEQEYRKISNRTLNTQELKQCLKPIIERLVNSASSKKQVSRLKRFVRNLIALQPTSSFLGILDKNEKLFRHQTLGLKIDDLFKKPERNLTKGCFSEDRAYLLLNELKKESQDPSSDYQIEDIKYSQQLDLYCKIDFLVKVKKNADGKSYYIPVQVKSSESKKTKEEEEKTKNCIFIYPNHKNITKLREQLNQNFRDILANNDLLGSDPIDRMIHIPRTMETVLKKYLGI